MMKAKVWCAHILHTELGQVLKLRIMGPDDPVRLVGLVQTAISGKWYSEKVRLLFIHEEEEAPVVYAETAIENMIFQGMALVHGLLFLMHFIIEKKREAGEL